MIYTLKNLKVTKVTIDIYRSMNYMEVSSAFYNAYAYADNEHMWFFNTETRKIMRRRLNYDPETLTFSYKFETVATAACADTNKITFIYKGLECEAYLWFEASDEPPRKLKYKAYKDTNDIVISEYDLERLMIATGDDKHIKGHINGKMRNYKLIDNCKHEGDILSDLCYYKEIIAD